MEEDLVAEEEEALTSAPMPAPPPKKATCEADAAVGSISHILRTLFRNYYDDDVDEDEAEPEDGLWFHDGLKDVSTANAAAKRVRSIGARLKKKREQADDLLRRLSDEVAAEKLRDEEEEVALKKRGLLVNVHVPMAAAMTKEQLNNDFTSTITARELIEANRQDFLRRNGLIVPQKEGEVKKKWTDDETNGYLKSTNADSIRTKLALTKSRGPRGDRFEGPAAVIAKAREDLVKAARPPSYDERRDIDDKILARMHSKLRYLKNPRYDPSNPNNARRLVAPETTTSSVLIIEPMDVFFENFLLANSYAQTITIRNATAISRRVKLLRPRTRFFSVDHFKWPGDESGTLAPGMALRLVVRFVPEALTLYNDTLTIVCESGTHAVALRAACEPPLLEALPDIIDIGPCFLGTISRTTIDFLNAGGPSHFRFLPTQDDDDMEHPEELQVVDYKISPAVFDLAKGDTAQCEVIFEPSEAGRREVTFRVVGGANCAPTTRTIVGCGETVDLVGETLVDFGNVDLGGTADGSLNVTNRGQLPVDFRWDLDENHGVDIVPQSGTLDASSTTSFSLGFAPQSTDDDDEGKIANLVVVGIPKLAAHGLDLVAPRESDDEEVTTDAKALSVTLKGRGQEFALEVSPTDVAAERAVVLGGTTDIAEITLKNPSTVPVQWRWDDIEEDDSLVTVAWSQNKGVLGPRESIVTALAMTGQRAGVLDDLQLRCIASVSLPRGGERTFDIATVVTARAIVTDAEVRFAQDAIDFGLVALESETEKVIQFTNPYSAPVAWAFSPDDASGSRVEVEPPDGVLYSQETTSVTVRCVAGTTKDENVHVKMACKVQSGVVPSKDKHLEIKAQVIALKVHLTATDMDFATVYVGVPVSRRVSILNKSPLPANFQWQTHHGPVDISPVTGTLAPGSSQEIVVTLTAHATGVIGKEFLCKVDGMALPLKLHVKAVSKGAVLMYELIKDDDPMPLPLAPPDATQLPPGIDIPHCPPPPNLDFGADVPLFERRKLRFVVRNCSAIPAHYAFKAAKYTAAEPPEEQKKKEHGFSTGSGLLYMASRDAEVEDAAILREGRGMAFGFSLESGVIPAWGVTVVEVTAFNNMAGHYADNVECTIVGMPLVKMPVRIGVVGCPLSLKPTCVGLDVKSSKLDLGQVLVGTSAKTIKRTVRVRNAGPVDAKLHWKIGPADRPTSDRLVDVRIGPPVTIRWHEEPEFTPPFTIEPAYSVVPKRSDATLVVTMPAENVAPNSDLMADKPPSFHALVTADASWITPLDDSLVEVEENIEDDASGGGHHHLQHQGSAASLCPSQSSGKKSLSGVSSMQSLLGHKKTEGPDDAPIDGAVSLVVNVSLVEPKLILDQDPDLDGDHTINFSSTTAIVARYNKQKKMDPSLRQRTSMKNPLDVPVECTLEATPPFRVASVRTASFVLKQQEPFTLAPRESMSVELHFEPPKSQSTEKPDPSRLKIDYDGSLTAHFHTGQTQVIRLHGDVLRPLVIAAPAVYDFGLVSTVESTSLTVFLSNPSDITAEWSIVHVPMTKSSEDVIDAPDVFAWAHQSGQQRGPTLPVTAAAGRLPKDVNRSEDALFPQSITALSWKPNSDGETLTTLEDALRSQAQRNPRQPTPLAVTFTPTSNVRYASRFRFLVKHGVHFDVLVSGQGSYDEIGRPPHLRIG